jgi:hypothetical protein
VLHRVLDDWLEQQRRRARVADARRHVDRHAKTILEPRALDFRVRLDDLEPPGGVVCSPSDRRTPRSSAVSCISVSSATRRGLNQITDRRQRVEEEVRVSLRPQRAQLRLGRQLRDLLLAHFALVALRADADAVDPARGGDRRRIDAERSSESSRLPPVSSAMMNA